MAAPAEAAERASTPTSCRNSASFIVLVPSAVAVSTFFGPTCVTRAKHRSERENESLNEAVAHLGRAQEAQFSSLLPTAACEQSAIRDDLQARHSLAAVLAHELLDVFAPEAEATCDDNRFAREHATAVAAAARDHAG